ncbi:sulfatase [Haloarcula salinisoli]|uniref:Sulfatase-like hydrolase/transferase n=1 Tax=Haloarcula salinisoli TaxID=2487746 RepID=A0A8J7YHZ0_9EURY|nr:sulfatase [Halomicroarcula salinisoli]MBX0303034.1 sulfatase-like hydrolase/transferase [Halomicroarcula salinisoli]
MGVRNVILITVDSLRYDRTLGMPDSATRAPTLNRLAEEFVSFDQAVANGPNTPSSFPTILTGTHPLMYGGYRYLDEQRPFLSETFRDAGWTTVGYHSNPHLGPEKNYNHGFDTFNDGGEDDDDAWTLKNFVDERLDPDGLLYKLLRRGYHMFQMTADTSAYVRAPEITDRATRWLDEEWDGDQPFFMWLHYMDVHYPFTPPDEHLEKQGLETLSTRRKANLNGMMQENPEELTDDDVADLLSLYDGEIRLVDETIERLLDDLETRGILDDTAIVVTADHGEAFGEHDRFGHHPYLYDELLRVPLIIRAPGLTNERVDEQVSLIDLGPTMFDLVDIETPERMQGVSRAPCISSTTMGTDLDAPVGGEEMALCTGRGGKTLASRTDRWKCFWRTADGVIELYDLMNDPDELEDVSDHHPAVVDEHKTQMQTYLDEADATDITLPEVDESEAVKQRLEDLGYKQ